MGPYTHCSGAPNYRPVTIFWPCPEVVIISDKYCTIEQGKTLHGSLRKTIILPGIASRVAGSEWREPPRLMELRPRGAWGESHKKATRRRSGGEKFDDKGNELHCYTALTS